MITAEEQHLLQQGIKEYVDVLNALSAFRSLIQRKWRSVVEANQDEYSKVLGIDVPETSDFNWSDADGSELAVGVKFIHKKAHFCHCLYWGRTEGGHFENTAMIWVASKQENLERLRKALRSKGISCDEADTVFVGEQVNVGDGGSIETKLATLMQRWIDLWRKAGGIKVVGIKSP